MVVLTSVPCNGNHRLPLLVISRKPPLRYGLHMASLRLARRPIWREARLGLEAVSLLRDPIFSGAGVESGSGQPVLVIPGFLVGDDSLSLMTLWLERTGHRPHSAGIRLNADCAAKHVDRLTGELEKLVATEGRSIAIVGQSRGGLYARVLAVRRPELVSGIVTLGAAHVDPRAVHPIVSIQARALSLLGSLGTPGLLSDRCYRGECCVGVSSELCEAFPAGVGFVSVYSRGDGIVDWRACLDPAAECVEVESSHCGMGVYPEVYRVIARALSEFRR
jgi:pimeloyl-ACP methyl ester carboxylesterase